MSVPARIALAAIAVLAAGWFAVGIRQSHAVTAARAQLAADLPAAGHRQLAAGHGQLATGQGRLTAAQARRADDLLAEAASLNPDHAVDVLRAEVALARGETAQAQRRLRAVVAAEPQDLDAWIALARSLPDTAPARRAALLHILTLAPVVKPLG